MKISILLPYKENFSPIYAGAVSLFVKDTTILSKFKKNITIYGNTDLKKIYKLNYKNIFLKKNLIQSGSKVYVEEFLKYEKNNPSDIIEIHNRPNYFHLIYGKIKNKKIVLYFHNDPLTMTGSRSVLDRKKLLLNATKIIFNSHWSRKRFLEGIEGLHINSEKMNVIYQSTNPVKINLKKKKQWITFVGKLNRAKGYDLFGQATLKILKKFKKWEAIVMGDEPRHTLNFKHKRLKNLGFQNHDKVLKIFEKTSIAVACSRWDEPLGRTSLEASSRGCATIISNKGGLPETVTHGIILKDLNVEAVYLAIKDLIENKKKRLEMQKLSIKNFFHTNKVSAKNIDNYREKLIDFPLVNKIYLHLPKRIRILHVTNFNERHDGRLFFNTGRRLNNGFIRLGHSVLEFSDRDIVKHYKNLKDYTGSKALNQKLVNTVYNYKPDMLIFGHADLVKDKTLCYLKDNYKNLKIAQWFLDPLIEDGPDFNKNKSRMLDKIEYTDANFLTTSPDVLNFLPKKKRCLFMPNPTDPSFEVLNNYANDYCSMDVFFALSHGVHRGILKRGKYDERTDFVNKLVEITPNVKFDLYGINNIQPIWADSFLKSISNAKMGVNLSRGNPIKYYSSDRITQLIGNGLLTFIHENTHYNNFFENDELIFYSNLNNLSEKIQKFAKDDSTRKKIAKKGKAKYMKYFNSTIVAEYIISNTFDIKYKKGKYMWEN
jgi:glycosyltransferase involved in cell wall biosynthesis|tara:strand:+ start:69 stop:2207 length:2139 start_codon:yes stop_codon:yes gene_type:complete